jgi:uncharacterized phage-associated protein
MPNNCVTSAFAVANWFLTKAKENGKTLTHMKLQKLVYLAYGWYYAYNDVPLFDEGIFAWQHGPVIAALYGTFKDCGREPIDHLAEYSVDKKDGNIEKRPYAIQTDDIETKLQIEEMLEFVWKIYSPLSAFELRNLTHRQGSPWRIVYEAFGKTVAIDPKEIYRYFTRLIEQYTKRLNA